MKEFLHTTCRCAI